MLVPRFAARGILHFFAVFFPCRQFFIIHHFCHSKGLVSDTSVPDAKDDKEALVQRFKSLDVARCWPS